MDNQKLYLLKEVFTKVKKDPMTNKYTIYKEDYLLLSLNKETLKLLENMCQEHNIHLEKLPKSLTMKETNELFIRYNYLKNYIKEHQNNQNIQQLQKEIIEIKQTIVLGHMKLMYLFLNNCFPNLIKEEDSEEIYQTGYEFLLWSIDKYNINKNVPFNKFLKRIITNRLSEKIWQEKRKISLRQSRDIAAILPGIDKIEEELSIIDINEIEKQTGISENRIRYLLLTILKENEISSEELPEEYFYEESFEEELLNKIERENIRILLETIPETQKQVIKLYYGFIDGKRYNHKEIAEILGYNSEERVRQIKEKALETLSIPIYRQAIDSYSENTKIIDDRIRRMRKKYEDRRQAELEEQIISTLPKEKLIELIEDFPPMYKEILELYFGLKSIINPNGINFGVNEISKILGKKENIIKERIQKAIKRVAIQMNKNKNIPYTHNLVEYYLKTKRR